MNKKKMIISSSIFIIILAYLVVTILLLIFIADTPNYPLLDVQFLDQNYIVHDF